MKTTLRIALSVFIALFTMTEANAMRWYSPNTGHWFSRDPIGENGFELLRGRPVSPLAGEPNRYLFVKNSPVNYFDALGLDIWVIRDASGIIRHAWAVGNYADGTYWSSDFMPTAKSLIGRANCVGKINFTPSNLVLIPTNLTSDFVIEQHTVVSQTATDAAREYAKQRSEKADRYDVCGNNCITWANGLAQFAVGRQIRENLDKIKNEKK